MHYLKPKFTLPATRKASQMTWDFAFLSESEFKAKYGEIKVEFHTDQVPATLPEHCGSTLVVTSHSGS